MGMGYRFNPPPNWPAPPPGWVPVPGWQPSPEWPAPPPGWQLWIDDTAYSAMSQRGSAPAPGSIAPQMPPPRRVRRKPPRKRNIILLAIAVLFLIGAIGDALGVGKQANTAATAPTTAASHAAQPSLTAKPKSSARPNPTAKAEAACGKRGLASGDIYVRMISPGIQWTAQELGGEWVWDFTLHKCLTSVQMNIATAPRSAGNCTQVGYVADNPGYNVNATVAPPLTHVAAQAGPACQTAAGSTPVQTTPVAAPAPPASTAPAGCYPLSDEGTCFEPGEYCRDDDHGVSGVAGDGKAIICEDNDGWRWEPA
jgi:hypothetical protein